jgi:hypothetical protein
MILLEPYLHQKFPKSDFGIFGEITSELELCFSCNATYPNLTINPLIVAKKVAMQIFDEVFANPEEIIWLLIIQWKDDIRDADYLYEQINPDIEKRLIKTVNDDGFEDLTDESSDIRDLFLITLKKGQMNYQNILTSASGWFQGSQPEISQRLFFINPQKDIIYYLWDCLLYLYFFDKKTFKYYHVKYADWINTYRNDDNFFPLFY